MSSTSLATIQQSHDSLFLALSSCENLVQYLDADREIQNLTTKAKQTPSLSTHLAYNRWSLAWLKIESSSLYCFRKIFNYSEPAIHYYFPNFTKKIQVKIKHKMFQHRTHYYKNLFKEHLLTRSFNGHQPENSDFYLHPNVGLRVRKFENNQCKFSSYSQKRFLMLDGICKGMCDWFTHLYFKTLPYYSTPDVHLQSIAKLFENGAPRQAEILQLFGWAEDELRNFILGLEIKKGDRVLLNDKTLLSIKNLKEDKTNPSLFIKDLPSGVYSVELMAFDQGHAISYFKISENVGFIFDPNIGLIKLARINQHEDLVEKLLNITRFLKFVDENSYFHFHQITQFNHNMSTKTKYTISIE